MQFCEALTPLQTADTMQGWVEAGTCDGLTVVAPIPPHTIDDFADKVVPILRERRLVWASYGDHPSAHAGVFGLDALDCHASRRTHEHRRRPSATSPH